MKEQWKWIKGFEGSYKISNAGRIKSYKTKSNTLLNPFCNDRKLKYYRVCLSINNKAKKVYISRLVAKHFIPNPLNKPQVNHKDGNHRNNHFTNLEWVTSSENILHSYNTLGNKAVGCENHYKAKLTNNQVKEIRKLYKTNKYTQTKLAEMFSIGRSNVCSLLNNLTWKGILNDQQP